MMRRRSYLRRFIPGGILATSVVSGPTSATMGQSAGHQTAHSNNGWSQEAKLTAADGDSGDRFGYPIAVSEDGKTAAVGVISVDTAASDTVGAAYVFSRDDQSWTQVAKLTAADGNTDDEFGWSMAMSKSGATLVVGAPKATTANGEDSGAAFVFHSDGGEWNRAAKLIARNGETGDAFGKSVTISLNGETIVVGAPDDANSNGSNAGAAYVFQHSEDRWHQSTKVTADSSDTGNLFGRPLAISSDGSTVVVGAPLQSNSVQSSTASPTTGATEGTSGPEITADTSVAEAVFVFTNADGEWTKEAKLQANDADTSDEFGSNVEIAHDGTTILVSAYDDEDPAGTRSGSGYVFSKTDGTWSQAAKLTADDAASGDLLGAWMSLSGDGTTAVLGSINDTNSNGDRAGSAYVFSSVDGSWDQSTKLLPEDGDDTDFFGEQIDLSTDGTTAIVGNSLDDPTKKDAGSVYVFTKTGGSWNQSAKLTASDGEREDLLGISTALSDDGTTVVAGADGDDTQRGKDVGSAYVFSRRAEIVNLSLQPSKVGGNNSTTHTLSFALRKISADGSTDEFEISFPESVVLKSFSNLSINTSVWSVEQQDNALRFSVNPKGGGVVRIEVTLDVKLTAAE